MSLCSFGQAAGANLDGRSVDLIATRFQAPARPAPRQIGLKASKGWRQSSQWRIDRHWVGPKALSRVVRADPQ
jgi:hypothetical protein